MFESFHFDPSFPRHHSEPPDVEISLMIESNALVINNVDELNEDECFDPGGDEINIGRRRFHYTIVIRRTFLSVSHLTLRFLLPLLSSHQESEDNQLLTPDICHLSRWASHRDGTCTDIAKILRKRSKPDNHEHGNGIECAKAGRML
ncbi:hypothetical protein Tco_1154428 [Tanacetum coccineum]